MTGMRLILVLAAVVAALGITTASASAAGTTGATAIALDGRVDLAWPSAGPGSTYTVHRGTSEGAITTEVTPAGGIVGTSFTDAGVSNGTTYYYRIRATPFGAPTESVAVRVTPKARGCSTGNPVVLENCYPGNSDWTVHGGADGIDGFASAQSVNKGQAIDIKVDSAGRPFDVEIYRSGSYGGTGARLMSTLRAVPGQAQPACTSNPTTGLVDCSEWHVSTTISTTASWTSGIYLLRIVRDDTGADNHILLAVRDDARRSDLVYGAPFATYQAYNGWGGKSLYDFNSTPPHTVSGSPRAVEVSFDRPYTQSGTISERDWYTVVDQPFVAWMESQGYDVSYIANTDLERDPGLARNGKAYIAGAHDEYWSATMRGALEQARDGGHGLFFVGGNAVYWKVRFVDHPVTGGDRRIMVNYKTTQSGGPDPSGIHTGTWRDPAGADHPENALLGVYYIGDKDWTFFPFVVTAEQGRDRVYRNTGLDSPADGVSTSIGSTIVGWEWDQRADNGAEPAGLKTLSSSPVDGQMLQDAGRVYAPGTGVTSMVRYVAPSGALVVATGTNNWWRGLTYNVAADGEPDRRIQQTTTNILLDLGAVPATPSDGLVIQQLAPEPGGNGGEGVGDVAEDGGGTQGALGAGTTTTTVSPTSTPAVTQSSSATVRVPLIRLSVRSNGLSPRRVTLSTRGLVTFKVTNRSRFTRRVLITGYRLAVRTAPIAPGRTVTMRVRLRGSRYTLKVTPDPRSRLRRSTLAVG